MGGLIPPLFYFVKIKDILKIEINFILSFILILIFFSIILVGFIIIQNEIADLRVYASSVDIIKDIKNSQYIAIVKNEPFILTINDNKIKIRYTKEDIDFINRNPLFDNILVSMDKDKVLIMDVGTFEFYGDDCKISLKSGKIYYKIILSKDGKINIEKSKK